MKKRLTELEKGDNKQLLYEELTKGAQFREQYRLVFAATIVATFYVAPSGNILEGFIKLVLGISMFFAASYLIYTAISVKYKDTHVGYQVFYASDRVRIKAYDFAVDTFPAGFLLFISLVIVGYIQKIFGLHPDNTQVGVMVFVCMFILAGLVGIVGLWFRRSDANTSEDINKLI